LVNTARPPALWPKELSLQSIRGRIALLLALAFLPAGGVALQAGMTSLAARQAAVQETAGTAELQAMGDAREKVTQLREVARTLAANAYLFASDRRLCRQTLLGFVEEFPELAVVSVLDRQGVVECANIPGAQGVKTAAAGLIAAAARSDDVIVGFVSEPRLSSEPVIAAVARAQISDAHPPQYVGVTRLVRPLIAQSSAARARAHYGALVSRRGDILDIEGLDANSDEGRRLTALLHQRNIAQLTTANHVGRTWAVVTPLEEGELYLLRGWTPAPASLAQRLRAGWALLAPILLWLAAVAAAWYAVELFVARPLLVVERLARAYARGEDSEADERLLRGAPDEISSLRRTLMAMAKTLRGRETRLMEALHEERALLHEVNHRVKNNLQLVASMLSIQARHTADKAEAHALARAQSRVQLLALAHARIYASGALRQVALDDLAAEIGRTVLAARGAETAHVKLEMALDPARASADRALPLAFLIGESLGDALDCLPAGEEATLQMRLQKCDEGGFTFELAAPSAQRSGQAAPTVERIIEAFARQIGATVSRDPGQSCFTRIEVPPRGK
jgi:two-component system, sensor histidine kinase PdtaS